MDADIRTDQLRRVCCGGARQTERAHRGDRRARRVLCHRNTGQRGIEGVGLRSTSLEVQPLGRGGGIGLVARVRVLVIVRVCGDAVLMLGVGVVSRGVDVPGQRRRPQGEQRA